MGKTYNKFMGRSEGLKEHDGITVITPSYKGEKYILKLLESMKDQKLSYDLFEHIIIINGELDRTPQIVEDFKLENPKMDIKILFSDIANASHARNIGIAEVGRKYTTFIDDDDYISPNFLKELYKNAKEDRIVLAGFLDVNETTGEISHSYVTPELVDNSGVFEDLNRLNAVLTINACKLIPSLILKRLEFNENLSSGEDIVFFCRLLSSFDFDFYVTKNNKKAIYYRLLRSNSVSRKEMSFKFNVIERLAVIKELNELMNGIENVEIEKFIKQKIIAQSLFIHNYLLEYPDENDLIRKNIEKSKLQFFPYSVLNKNLAKKLVISYNFPPYIDTSGNVMAKRINEKAEIVDVIHNKMDRDVDEEINLIADKYIDKKILINSPFTFRSWKPIKKFVQMGIDKINKIVLDKGEYEEIYSRIMFPASHFLAFEYKIQYPNVKWTAEFSDPLLYDINGDMRIESINDSEYMDNVNNLLDEYGFPQCDSDNLFFLGEYLTYLFADEIVFTNENQKKYIITKFPNQNMVEMIMNKSRIEKHPMPPKEDYYLRESNYPLDNSYVNIAYFGGFYATRDMDDVFCALHSLDNSLKSKCKIHFFTSDVESFKELVSCIPVWRNIEINSYVNFFEFLNLTTKLDCLIVNDAHTKGFKEINPYLPSKLSDYLGSGSDIWIIYEEGSIMSQYDVKYKSILGDICSTKHALKKIIEDHS